MFSLSPRHYAHKWDMQTVNDRDTVNRMAVEYASLPEGPEKEDKLLSILKAFHNYVWKYGSMITSGHLPPGNTPAGRDASKMLLTLLPKGTKPTRQTLGVACRTLHLAFKQQSHDDIYDILSTCIMKSVRKYDPFYHTKVKAVCEKIDEEFPDGFTEPAVSGRMGFNCLGCLRMLVRRGQLESISEEGKVVGYKRTATWPPPKEFFESGPIGFAYFVPMYFRYYLHEYISNSMGEIESKDGMLQLGHGHSWQENDHNPRPIEDRSQYSSYDSISEGSIPHSSGSLTNYHGSSWAADMKMVIRGWDLSTMDEEWIHRTSDRLFRKLTVAERYILYLHFVEEYKLADIASALQMSISAVQKKFKEIMDYLKARANKPVSLETAQ